VFDDGGPGAHLSTRTLFQLQYTWGKFLFFLAGNYPELLKRDPGHRINAKKNGQSIRRLATVDLWRAYGQHLRLPSLACSPLSLSKRELVLAVNDQQAHESAGKG
jgi:hypothetical protein